jgi:hypothetical protein
LLALRLFLPEVYWSQFCFFASTFGWLLPSFALQFSSSLLSFFHPYFLASAEL